MLLFRVDDFPLTKPEEAWRHNTENFIKFNDVMKENEVRYVLGVIPRHTSKDQIKFLSEQRNIEVALHGVNHDEKRQNEFEAHMTTDDITKSISSATKSLSEFCGVIEKYIPPHNCVDSKTIVALRKCHFNTLLCGPGTSQEMLKFAEKSGLKTYYSAEPLQYGRTDELLERGSVDHLKKVSDKEDVYLTLHWTWEFNIGLDNLRKFLTKLREKQCHTQRPHS